MSFTTGLYYPWIDIKDDNWLKSAVLYWDTIRTIVPKSIENPYSKRTANELREAGILVPLRVHPNMEEIEPLSEDVASNVVRVLGKVPTNWLESISGAMIG